MYHEIHDNHVVSDHVFVYSVSIRNCCGKHGGLHVGRFWMEIFVCLIERYGHKNKNLNQSF